MESDNARAEHAKHLAFDCPTPDACACSVRKPGTLLAYQAQSYTERPLYCACEAPSFTPIVKSREGLSGGHCGSCGGTMRPREAGRMPEPSDRLAGPTYDRWMWADDGYGGRELVRGEPDEPETRKLRHTRWRA